MTAKRFCFNCSSYRLVTWLFVSSGFDKKLEEFLTLNFFVFGNWRREQSSDTKKINLLHSNIFLKGLKLIAAVFCFVKAL